VPAAAVIPAPIVYIKVAAVKKLVVGFRSCRSVVSAFGWLRSDGYCHHQSPSFFLIGVYWMLTSYFLVTLLLSFGEGDSCSR
jgi:hydrogenase-4 membrane subunit HyfE